MNSRQQTAIQEIPSEGQDTAQWLLEQYHTIEAENCELRERNAELEELLTSADLHAEDAEQAEAYSTDKKQDAFESSLPHQLRAAHQHIIDLQTRLARRTESEQRYKALIDWSRKLFANHTIPEACKLVLWHFYTIFFFMRTEIIGEEMHIGVEDTANALGLSTSTIRKATDKAEMWEVLQRRYEPYETEDGDKRTRVHITLSEATAHPDSIQMAKLHGGKRIKKCPKCGSEDVDRYTVQYCRHCNKNAWYGQPGLRADADVLRAQQAENTPIYTSGKKQDAFDTHEHEITHLSARIDNALVVTQQQTNVIQTRAQQQEAAISPDLPALPLSGPEPQQDPLLEARKFYEAFCSKPGHHLRLRPDGDIGVGVPEQVSDIEFEHLAEQVSMQEEALRQIIQERNPAAQHSRQAEHPPSTQLATQHPISVFTASYPGKEKPPDSACQAQSWLNKDGKPAGAHEKVVGYRNCGSTQWTWSSVDQGWLCAKCHTPQSSP